MVRRRMGFFFKGWGGGGLEVRYHGVWDDELGNHEDL